MRARSWSLLTLFLLAASAAAPLPVPGQAEPAAASAGWLHHEIASNAGGSWFVYEERTFERPFTLSVDLAFMSTPVNYGKIGGLVIASEMGPEGIVSGYEFIRQIEHKVIRYQEGVGTELFTGTGPDQADKQVRTWSVEATPPHLLWRIDGQPVADIADEAIAGPFFVGVMSRSPYPFTEQHLHFDDLRVVHAGQTIFEDGFGSPSLAGWTARGAGRWTAPVAPGVPVGLSARHFSCPGLVMLEWGAPADDGGARTDYRIYRVDDGQELLGSVFSWASPRISDSQLALGETRTYAVSAVNEAGEGPLSAPVSFTAPLALPSAPTWAFGWMPSWAGPGRGEISLQAYQPEVPACAASYRIYRGETPDVMTPIADVAMAPARVFRDTGLPDGASFYYRASAINAHGEGLLGPAVVGTAPSLPSVPRNLTVAPGHDQGQVRLAWATPAHTGGVPFEFRVYRQEPTGEVIVATTKRSGYVDEGLGLDEAHTYRVAAVNIVGEGDSTATAASHAQRRDNPHEDAPLVVLTDAGASPHIDVTDHGTIRFRAAGFSFAPAGGQCFDFRGEHHRAMFPGETYAVMFRYDVITGHLEASTDGGSTFRTCAWDQATFEHGALRYSVLGTYPEPDGVITVWA